MRFVCGTALVLRDDSSIVMGTDRLFKTVNANGHTVERSEGEKCSLWGDRMAVGACGVLAVPGFSFGEVLPEYSTHPHVTEPRQLAQLIRDRAAEDSSKFDKLLESGMNFGDGTILTYVVAGFTRDAGSPEAFSVDLQVEPSTNQILVPAISEIVGCGTHRFGQTNAIDALLDHREAYPLFDQRVLAYRERLLACAPSISEEIRDRAADIPTLIEFQARDTCGSVGRGCTLVIIPAYGRAITLPSI